MVTQPAFSIAPALYSGVKIWSYFSNGYAESNSRSKNSKPDLGQVEDVVGVDVLEERATRIHPELDRTAAALDGVGDADVGPGHERRDVGGEDGRRARRPTSRAAVPSRSPAGVGSGVGETDRTVQCAGAVTVKAKVALRSGCSKTAKTRRESGTSNWL